MRATRRTAVLSVLNAVRKLSAVSSFILVCPVCKGLCALYRLMPLAG